MVRKQTKKSILKLQEKCIIDIFCHLHHHLCFQWQWWWWWQFCILYPTTMANIIIIIPLLLLLLLVWIEDFRHCKSLVFGLTFFFFDCCKFFFFVVGWMSNVFFQKKNSNAKNAHARIECLKRFDFFFWIRSWSKLIDSVRSV